MTTAQANTRQLRCIRNLAKAWHITKEQAALIWCQSCAKKWREGIA
jgi:hypothetical protein